MALNSTQNRISYAGNGVTTAFSFPYYFLQSADLKVILRIESTGVETTQILNTNYTVSGAGNPSGGTVTMSVAPAVGRSLIIFRDPEKTQDLDLVENDPLPAEELEKRLDKLTMIAQRLSDRADRFVGLTDGYTDTFDPRIPAIFDPLQVLRINAAGDAFDFVDQSQFNFDGAAPTTTKGDIIVYDQSGTNVRKGVGANGTLLTPDSAESDGLDYKTPAELSLVTYTGTETLTNKTLTTPIVTSPRLDDYTDWEEVATPANPSAGYRRLYVKSDGKLYGLDSLGNETLVSGGGAGGINYISNPDAESSATGWTTYADAAATTPVNGTGGSPTVTVARVTSTPLRGLGMFRLTKDASNRQGEGVSYDFTIANADKAQMLNISFEYAVSANFVAGSDSTLGDLNVYIYDVTNSQLIQPAPFKLVGGTGNNHKFSGKFQSASNSTSYRLILHIAGTTASAWTFDFDNVTVGPQILLQTSAMSDWTAYTPTSQGFGTLANVAAFYKRVGDSVYLAVKFDAGTPTAAEARIGLPPGLTAASTSLIPTIRKCGHTATSENNQVQSVLIEPSVTYVTFGRELWAGGFVPLTKADGVDFISAAGTISFFTTGIPIAGWSSNNLSSNDADTRVCAARFTKTNNQSIPDNTNTLIDYETVDYDTHGAFNLSTDRYTAPVSGYYAVAVSTEYAANATGQRATQLYKNGSIFCEIGAHATVSATFTSRVFGNTTLYLNAGDYLEFYAYQSSGGNLTLCVSGDDYTYVSINRISGPALPVAGETVACFAWEDSNQVNLPDGVFTKMEFNTVDFDTHATYSTANNRYTAPISGVYELISQIRLDGGSAANETECSIYKNGVEFIRTNKNVVAGGDGIVVQGLLKLNAGDYIEVWVENNSGGTRTTSTTSTRDSNISIKKVA